MCMMPLSAAAAPRNAYVPGVMHGGAIMALADTLGGFSTALNLPEGAGTTTIESKTNFLRGVTGGVVTGTAKPVHAGRRTIVVQTELRDDAARVLRQNFPQSAFLAQIPTGPKTP